VEEERAAAKGGAGVRGMPVQKEPRTLESITNGSGTRELFILEGESLQKKRGGFSRLTDSYLGFRKALTGGGMEKPRKGGEKKTARPASPQE